MRTAHQRRQRKHANRECSDLPCHVRLLEGDGAATSMPASGSTDEPPSGNQEQLSGRLTGLQMAVRLGRLGQREDLADVKLEPPLAHQRETSLRALARFLGKPS